MKFYLVLYTTFNFVSLARVPETFESKAACEKRAMHFEGFKGVCLPGEGMTADEFLNQCKVERQNRITCPGATIEIK